MRLICKSQIFRSYSTQLPACNFQPKKYNGPSLEELTKIRQSRLNPALLTYYSSPTVFVQGSQQWLFDEKGKRYLDMFGGICTVSVGHCHPKVTAAIEEQSRTLCHVSNIYYHPKLHEYAQRLTDKFSGDLKVVYLVNSGSEANDLAILLARSYTRNFDLLSFKNSYHGLTYQVMGLTSNAGYKYSVPQTSGSHNVMNPDVYRGIWGGKHCRDSPVQTTRSCSCSAQTCQAKDNYIEQFQEMFKYNIRKGTLAGFFAESIQGVGGTVQYPKGFLQEAYRIVKDNGGVFISDEVQTGFGRTGDHFWGFEGHGLQPDIVTMAKGIGNGFPLAAVVTTPEIAQALTKANHFNTFGGNALASAVGIAVLDVIEEEKLQENSLKVGTHLLLALQKLREQFKIVGDVRGKGLMIGVEMVENGDRKAPLRPEKFMKIWEQCRDDGLILGRGGIDGNVFRIKPPMCVTKEDADFTVEVLAKALKQINS